MPQVWFITGTSTDVGKTWASAKLVQYLCLKELPCSYFKPIQTGAANSSSTGNWADDDTSVIERSLGDSSLQKCPPHISKPLLRFQAPESPYRAAALENKEIQFENLVSSVRDKVYSRPTDVWIIEGAGGLLVPITKSKTVADLICALQSEFDLKTLIVADGVLGVLNHSLLSLEVAQLRGIQSADLFINYKTPSQEPTLGPSHQEMIMEQLESRGLKGKVHLSLEEWAQSIENPKEDKWIEQDRANVWHPYEFPKMIPAKVLRASGSFLDVRLPKTGETKRVFDAISSWWCNILGHSHPELVSAAQSQMASLDHIPFADLTHSSAIEAAQSLASLVKTTGNKCDRVFFSDNGSTAVEVAIKMALGFSKIQNPKRKLKLGRSIVALKGAYHGDTLGAMLVSEKGSFHHLYKDLLSEGPLAVTLIDPLDPDALSRLPHLSEVCALIVEPLIQGAAGMKLYPPENLNSWAKTCKQHGILLICDEIFSGLYRTGPSFAFTYAAVDPDILCLSKGLTAGMLPLGATLVKEQIYKTFTENPENAFLHGHTFTGNPISTSICTKTLEILGRKTTQDAIKVLTHETSWALDQLRDKLKDHPKVKNVRTLGTVGAFDLDFNGIKYGDRFSTQLRNQALEQGVFLRPIGPTIYTAPSYLSPIADFRKCWETIEALIEEFSKR